jgi:hypothetical protein
MPERLRSGRRHLQTLLEAVAEIMGLHRGQTRLELVFDGGRLRTYWVHAERRIPGELAVHDEQAARLVALQPLAGGAEEARDFRLFLSGERLLRLQGFTV